MDDQRRLVYIRLETAKSGHQVTTKPRAIQDAYSGLVRYITHIPSQRLNLVALTSWNQRQPQLRQKLIVPLFRLLDSPLDRRELSMYQR